LTSGCKGTVYARRCHCLAASAAFTAKAAAWPTEQASRNGRRKPLLWQNRVIWTEVSDDIMAWLLLNISCNLRPFRQNVLLQRCPH